MSDKPTTLTAARLAEIRARNEARTTGEWKWFVKKKTVYGDEKIYLTNGNETIMHFGCDIREYPEAGCEPDEQDSNFIAHAPADITALLKLSDQLQADNDRLEAESQEYVTIAAIWGGELSADKIRALKERVKS